MSVCWVKFASLVLQMGHAQTIQFTSIFNWLWRIKSPGSSCILNYTTLGFPVANKKYEILNLKITKYDLLFILFNTQATKRFLRSQDATYINCRKVGDALYLPFPQSIRKALKAWFGDFTAALELKCRSNLSRTTFSFVSVLHNRFSCPLVSYRSSRH